MLAGFKIGLCVEFCYWIIICIAALSLKQPIMKLFVSSNETAMISLGVHYLSLMAFFYLLPGFTNGVQGFFRGMGNMKITLVSTIIQISIRYIFVYVFVPKLGMEAVAYGSLVGWVFMLAYEVPYYIRYKRNNNLLNNSNRLDGHVQLQK